LYGGYEPGLNHGKIGELHPIQTNKYACYYMSMKAQTQGLFYYQFHWGDELIPPDIEGMPSNLPIRSGAWKLSARLRNWPYMAGTLYGPPNLGIAAHQSQPSPTLLSALTGSG
jgi:hypothetical protein